MSTSRHNHIGVLSDNELIKRDIYCEKLNLLHDRRVKLASLKNLLKPTAFTPKLLHQNNNYSQKRPSH